MFTKYGNVNLIEQNDYVNKVTIIKEKRKFNVKNFLRLFLRGIWKSKQLAIEAQKKYDEKYKDVREDKMKVF
jgi:peptidylprolyl isomerase